RQRGTACHDESRGADQPDLLPGHLSRDALLASCGDEQVGEADGGGAGAEKEDPLLLELAAGELEGVDQSGKRDAGRTLDVVVVAGDLVSVTSQQSDRIDPGPVLEVNATVREDLLYGLHKLVHEGVQLLGRGAPLPHADVDR